MHSGGSGTQNHDDDGKGVATLTPMANPDERVELVSQVGHALDKWKKKREDYDVTLVCGNRKFLVHRSVLSDASPYFRSMFASAWKETLTGNVVMPTIAEDTMEVVIDFIYKEKFPEGICAWDMCLRVAEAAHFMEMPRLFSTCLHKLIKHANLNNIAKLHHVVELYNNWSPNAKTATGISSWGLNARIQTFLAKRFSRYVRKEEFLDMDVNQLKTILEHPELDILALEELVEAVLKWVIDDFDHRKGYLEELLNAINITSNHVYCCIVDSVTTNGHFSDFKKIFELLQTSSANGNPLPSSNDYGKKLLFFGVDCEGYHVMKTYDFTTNQWVDINQPPFLVLESVKAVGYSGHIYFLGTDETSSGHTQTKITRYCPYNNTIVSTCQLKYPVDLLAACGLHGAIYVLGDGKRGKEFVSVVQRYCPATSTCEEISNIDQMFSPIGMFASTNYIYVVCSTKVDRNKELLRYDPLYDTWTVVTRIPKEWNSYAFSVSNEKLFLVDEDLMIVYDIASDQWTDSTFLKGQVDIEKVKVFVRYGKEMLLARDCEFMTQIFEDESPQWKKDLLKKEDFMPPRFHLHFCEMLKCVLY